MLRNEPKYVKALSQWVDKIPIADLNDHTVLITGATGMIGSCLVDMLCQFNDAGGNIKIVATSRDISKLERRFGTNDRLIFLSWDARTPLNLDCRVDYTIHCASNADPISYAKYPVDTLMANVLGSYELLEYGRKHGLKRLLFVSSGEMYGQPDAQFSDFVEDYCGPVDYSASRACYPAGKRSAETLCQCYRQQYGIDTVIVRPCHIFGPTMSQSDSRAVSEFLKSAAMSRDIVMKSAGLVERSHCFVVDAVAAILIVLLRGASGNAYNISDPDSQMTIRDFAELSAKVGGCNVIYDNPSDAEKAGYSPVSRAVLNSDKLQHLGWRSNNSTISSVSLTIEVLKNIYRQGD